MKLFHKILLTALFLLILPSLLVGVISYYVSRDAIRSSELQILNHRLDEALRICVDHQSALLDDKTEVRPGDAALYRSQAARSIARIRFKDTGYVMAIDSRGVIVSHPDKDLVGTHVESAPWFEEIRENNGTFATFHWRGQSRIAITSYFVPWNWMLVSSVTSNEITRPIQSLGIYVLFSILLTAIVAAMVLLVFTRKNTAPIHSLIRGVDRIRRGDLETHLPITSGDEIGVLTGAFNSMTVKLKRLVLSLESRNVELQQEVAERRRMEEKYSSIFLNALEGIFQSTEDGRFIEVNPAMAQLLGYDSPHDLKTALTDISTQLYANPADRAEFLGLLRKHSKVTRFETRQIRKDGGVIWVNLNARAIKDEDGRIMLIEGLVEDITDRKIAEQKLAQLNNRLEHLVDERTAHLLQTTQELEEANRRLTELDEMKTSFLSTVSHDLRTPLTSVLGFTKMIDKDFRRIFYPLLEDDPGLEKKGRRILQNLEIVENEGTRLTRLINDFLDLTKIEAGRLEWHDSVVEPEQLVTQAVNAVSGDLQAKPELEIATSVQADLPLLRVDPDRLLQVLINLLGNAVKFTPRGRIEISATTAPEGRIRFSICDTGPGIPQNELKSIFDKFHQVRQDPTSSKPHHGGTGLGLAICKQIVEHYEGHIDVASELGKGSVFSFAIPGMEAHHRAHGVEEQADGEEPGIRPLVLVVEDDLSVRSYLTQLLRREGYGVVTAKDGLSALVKARDHKPDLVTMDLLMPVMDGQEAIRRLRANHELQAIPILVVTVVQDAESAGGDKVLYKPIDEGALLDAVDSLLGKRDGERRLLVLRTNGPEDISPYVTRSPKDVSHCSEEEMWREIDAGFKGTVILPAWAARSMDFSTLGKMEGIQLLILPETPPQL